MNTKPQKIEILLDSITAKTLAGSMRTFGNPETHYVHVCGYKINSHMIEALNLALQRGLEIVGETEEMRKWLKRRDFIA